MPIDFFGDPGSYTRKAYSAADPRGTFFSRQDQFGSSPARRNFMTNAYSQIYDRFLGNFQNQVRTGTGEQINQAGDFDAFMGDFDFNKFYQQSSPFERGASAFRNPTLNPNTRFLFNF